MKFSRRRACPEKSQSSNPRRRACPEPTSHNDLDQCAQNIHDGASKVQQELEPRRSKRGRIAKDLGPDFMTFNVEGEPQSYKAAMESSEAPY